ncbi:outer membrane beta-barrel protein [Pedobacter sp. SD-b]|uniref:Outer membrane beta-barrel protein n=1 Tax=Pedobacter segetis TaxID=2793069 RepID=A0ABS1BNH1_9SPHI|nr:outer membrane beta-barrel protein [Pedobacter segetis]MBK0384438.1 outer membrane beta-barrel protein [Pedobacter segetis]
MIKTKTLLSFVLFIISVKAFSQGNYGGGVDEKNIHFGFCFQYISSEYKIQKFKDWQAPFYENGVQVTQGLKSIRSIQNPGFGLGFVLPDFYITPNLNLRVTPTFIFTDRIIDYQFNDGASYDRADSQSPEGFTRRTVTSTSLEFPVSIKLKSDRRNNFRAYLIGGAKYSVGISGKKADDVGDIAISKLLKNKRNFLSYEAGIGFDLYFEYFKLSPEIKLSNSVNSVLIRENHPYSSPIDKLFLRNFIFSLYFE